MTGEAVALDLRTASFVTRGAAAAVDLVVQGLLLWGLALLVALSAGVADDAVLAGLALLAVVAILIGYPVLWETLTRGRSLGKLALGLRVVRDDGGPESFRQALVRALVGFGEIWLTSGVVALIASMASRRDKRVGDHLAGTLVVRVRVPTTDAPPPQVHPGLADWAASLELAALPDALALDVRTFLARAPHLLPDARRALAESLAAAVAARVQPPPPGPVPAELYLATVLAERTRREIARLAPAVPGYAAGPAYSPPAYPPPAYPSPPPARSSAPPSPPPPASRGGFAPPG